MTPSEVFLAARPRLVGIAYRLTGSLADAEDVAQDAWIRWQAADHGALERPEAWLTTVVTRLALDRLRSATARRVSYVGPWLPEPLVEPVDSDPAAMVELADSLTFAALTVLDTLTPAERVAVVLTDVFAMGSAEVGEVLERSPEAVRQLVSRGRSKLRASTGERPVGADRASWAVAGQLLAAVASGDVSATAALLSGDVELLSDGGPTRHAARRPVRGPERAARFLCNLYRRFAASEVEIAPATVNKLPGLVVSVRGRPYVTMAIATGDARVERVWLVSNPDKLAALSHQVELV